MQEGKYLTYSEYTSLGGKLDKTEFIKLEFEARKNIDMFTFGRLKNLKEQVEEVKMCVLKLIDILNNYKKISSRDKSVQSENTDGYTVTYNSTNISNIKSVDISDIITNCLCDCELEDGTPYLYRGI